MTRSRRVPAHPSAMRHQSDRLRSAPPRLPLAPNPQHHRFSITLCIRQSKVGSDAASGKAAQVRAGRALSAPLSLPAVSTIGVLVAVLAWGEFFGALILTGPNTVTAPVAMGNFISYDTNNWSALAAAGVVVIVPVLIATVVAQRGLLSGLTAGAVRQ